MQVLSQCRLRIPVQVRTERNGKECVSFLELSANRSSKFLTCSLSLASEEEISKSHQKPNMRTQKDFLKSSLPSVVIVGRPNVGKSALFNRFVGRELAIVYDEPGVTRDRHMAECEWCEQKFTVTDTGGVLTPPLQAGMGLGDAVALGKPGGRLTMVQAEKSSAVAGLPSLIEEQAGLAVQDADVIVFVVDGQSGPTSADEDIGQWLRRHHLSRRPILLAVNKCESPTRGLSQANLFWEMGFTPYAISAISGFGIADLLDTICSHFPQEERSPPLVQDGDQVHGSGEEGIGVAIIGRPNVGKSSLLNALLGEERAIVSPLSGTTRDAIDSRHLDSEGQLYRIIDTAGIRRRGAVLAGGSRTEGLSVQRALRAVGRADVAVVVLDALVGPTEQDYRLGERVQEMGKGCVIVVNKWDAVPEKDTMTAVQYEQNLRDHLKSLDWAPVVFASASSKQRVPRILEEVKRVAEQRAKRISTATLNQVVQEAFNFMHPGRGANGRRAKIYYCTQAAVNPPTFVFFVNEAKLFPEEYRRYMEKQLRKNIGFPGTPLRLLWRSKKRDANRGSSSSQSSD